MCVYEIPLSSPSEVNSLSEINWVGGGLVLDGGGGGCVGFFGFLLYFMPLVKLIANFFSLSRLCFTD